MRKIIQILGALLAVMAFSAVGATSAFATDEWLVGGTLVALGAKVSMVAKGTLLLKAEGFGGFEKTHFVCNDELIGTVNGLNASGRGTDTITEIANLTLNERGTLITCEVDHTALGSCSGSLTFIFHAIHLPWLTELLLRAGDTKPRDMIVSGGRGAPGFTLLCTNSTGGKFEETCEGNVETDQLTNEANGGVGAVIPETASEKCNNALATGHIKSSRIELTLSGQSLAVS